MRSGRAGPRCQPVLSFRLRDADHRRRDPARQPVGPEVQPRLQSRLGLECPAVGGEEHDRRSADRRGDASDDTRLRAVRVDDRRRSVRIRRTSSSSAARSRRPIRRRSCFTRSRQRPSRESLAKRPVAMGGHGHVVVANQRREQLRDARLRAADLGERDHDQKFRSSGGEVGHGERSNDRRWLTTLELRSRRDI